MEIMVNERQINQTAFDDLIQDQQLQMLKAAIPYLQTGQKSMAFLVKCMELQRTMSLFDDQESSLQMCSAPETEEPRTLQMLTALKEYCNEAEQENINMIINFLQMYSTYETLFN